VKNPPFKRTGFKLQGRALMQVFENLVLEMHPELMGFDVKITMEMDCEKHAITVIADVCETPPLFLDRPEQGKHLDS
jgi:ribosomal protein L5